MKPLLAALALSALCSNGFAASTASVTFGAPEFQLTDLNLDDGIGPMIDFENSRSDSINGSGPLADTGAFWMLESYWGMLLSPHTQLTLAIPATIDITNASGRASLFLGDAVEGFSLGSGPGEHLVETRILTATLANHLDTWIDLEYSTYWSKQIVPTAPIPEPATYALMLGGLGLLAAIRQKRSAKGTSR